MAEGILGLGSSGAASLNQELIDKLKTAERKATVEPIENSLEDLVKEKESFTEVTGKINELLASVRPFDLYITGGANVFNQKSALTSGDSVTFDAPDASKLNTGITSVNITQLAQKDVYQSKVINNADIENLPSGDLTIKVGDATHTFAMSDYDSFEKLTTAINNTIGINASFDQVGTSGGEATYRLILKSEESGLDNGLEISGSAASALNLGDSYDEFTYNSASITGSSSDAITGSGIITVNGTNYDTSSYSSYDDLVTAINADPNINASIVDEGGSFKINIENIDKKNTLTISGAPISFNESSTSFNAGSNVQSAQNMKASVDGIDYSVSSNLLEVDGLKMTATKIGESSINVSKDTSQIETLMKGFVEKYNEVTLLIGNEVSSAESTLSDRSSLRNIVDQIKDKLFGSYGANSESVFNYGFELDKSGVLSLDSAKLNEKIKSDPEGLKNLLVGTAENEGLGTQLKSTIDEMSFSAGVITGYTNSMTSREKTLKEDKEKAQETLDNKYKQLTTQFGAYAGIITQFESQFSSLKLMIQQSTSG